MVQPFTLIKSSENDNPKSGTFAYVACVFGLTGSVLTTIAGIYNFYYRTKEAPIDSELKKIRIQLAKMEVKQKEEQYEYDNKQRKIALERDHNKRIFELYKLQKEAGEEPDDPDPEKIIQERLRNAWNSVKNFDTRYEHPLDQDLPEQFQQDAEEVLSFSP